jgi:type VI secretion system protein ImpG
VDRRLLKLYESELEHLRAMLAEFAEENPKIAGRLGVLNEREPCQDPFVERLLEGFAFLTARIQLKLNAEFPRFTQTLLETIYPHYLAPTPDMFIAHFSPNLNEAGLADGFLIPHGSSLYSELDKDKKIQTHCEYRIAHDVTLWPLKINKANYYTRELALLEVPNLPDIKAGIRIRLQSTAGLNFNKLKLDSLSLHLMGPGEIPMYLYELFIANSVAIVVQPATRPIEWQKVLDASCIQRVGFENQQKLLPFDARSFQGYRLLHEYFSFPKRFMFIKLVNLHEAIKLCDQNQLDVIVLFKKSRLELEREGAVKADNFKLFCSPAINLFEKRIDRIHVSDKFFEFHVVPDRSKTQDFEVYKLTKVVGYGLGNGEPKEFLPFYHANDIGDTSPAYYVTNRVPRPKPQDTQSQGQRTLDYGGSEVYLSLVDSSAAPFKADIKQLGIEALCTNRDLPIHAQIGRKGKSEFTMDKTPPCISIYNLDKPTDPKPSHVEGEIAWRIINHLSLNYLSLTDTDDREGAVALRNLLRLYSDTSDLQAQKQIKGVKSVNCRPITRGITTSGSIAFVRGLEVTVTVEEAAFNGLGVFLFGAVLEQFFAKYVSINSFTETVVKTLERGEIMRWKMRNGLRPIL